VRNLVGIDPNKGWIAIGDLVSKGDPIMFTRRDKPSAETDLDRMLSKLKQRIAKPIRGGIYVSCLSRGVNLFGPDAAETRRINAQLGDFPLVGFFANGEISHDRLYAHTGVLTLFT
jgi:small ligand-binding sensory domain FIST